MALLDPLAQIPKVFNACPDVPVKKKKTLGQEAESKATCVVVITQPRRGLTTKGVNRAEIQITDCLGTEWNLVIRVSWFSSSLSIKQTLEASLASLCSVHMNAGLRGSVCIWAGGGTEPPPPPMSDVTFSEHDFPKGSGTGCPWVLGPSSLPWRGRKLFGAAEKS